MQTKFVAKRNILTDIGPGVCRLVDSRRLSLIESVESPQLMDSRTITSSTFERRTLVL